MADISGYGIQVIIQASNTLPVGVPITQFGDDADPVDIEEIQVADKAMGLNGDLLTWSKPAPLNVTLNLVPNSPEDLLMAALLEANRVGKGKIGARDVITMTIMYPDGKPVIFANGAITDGQPAMAISSDGRMKTKPYSFSFENKVGI